MNFKSICSHSVTRNAFALGIMQVASFIVPLLILPYLTRTIGIDAFGVVLFTLAAIQLAYIVTDYGFSLYAVYEISHQRENTSAVNFLLGSIYGAKVLLVLIAGTIVYFAGFFSEYDQYQNIFLFAVFAVICQAFQPIWFFQGVERMKNITIFIVISKVIYAVLVLIWVNDVEDTPLVILAWSIAQGIGSIIAVVFIYREGYAVLCPTVASIIRVLKNAGKFFGSRIAVAVYTSANTLLLGLVSTSTHVAIYGACNQLYSAGQQVTLPINQALYPYMVKQKDWRLFLRLVSIVGVSMIIGVIFISFWLDSILQLIYGDEFSDATSVMAVFLVILIVNYFGSVFGYPVFGALGDNSFANYSVMLGAIFHIIIIGLLYATSNVTAISVAYATLVTESVVMFIRVYKIHYLYKHARVSIG